MWSGVGGRWSRTSQSANLRDRAHRPASTPTPDRAKGSVGSMHIDFLVTTIASRVEVPVEPS